ncbi:uncharacterized protein LOC125809052 [Solanum verrucosum]|uniref:uncharacterized protein LOC125809052 n=1 Tax=Solanum verrucosum TaxID=315347 RepID=UPI0020D0E7B7|nr:uncharacterized protein LOC125809052 [Solanum verrucosum]
MNSPNFTGSSVTEDPENFVEELQKVFEIIHIADVERVELDAYQLKGVARIWFDQWKKNKVEDAPIMSWSQGSVALGGNGTPACAKYGRTHLRVCHDGSTGCVKCGQNGHFMKECIENMQGDGNRGNRAQSSSAAPPNRVAPRGATSQIDEGANRLYAITSHQE